MKIGNVIDQQFQDVLAKLMAQPLPLKVAYKLHNIKKVADEEFAKYDKIRIEAISRFADKKEDGSIVTDDKGNAQFSPENLANFTKELSELLSVEFQHDKLSIEEMGSKIELSAQDLVAIQGILNL